MYNEEDIQVIPIECVYAIIEIKADIDKTEVIQPIFKNMKSVKDLEKNSYVKPQGVIQNFVTIYGKECEIWPVHYFVFALDSMNLETIRLEVERLNTLESRIVEKRIDCICVLNKGVILNRVKNEKLSAFPDFLPQPTFSFLQIPLYAILELYSLEHIRHLT